jgi:hypothetical protein
MHRGEDTAYYLAKGFRVVAFEAHPEHAAHNQARFASDIASLRIVEGAITEEQQGRLRGGPQRV